MLIPFKENTSFHLLSFLFRCQLIFLIPGEQGTPHVPMWHVAFGKHSLVTGIFYCLVVFNPFFWQALPSMAILVQGKSVVAPLCPVLCFPVVPGLKHCMFWSQSSIPLSC